MGRIFERLFLAVIAALSAITGSPMEGRMRTIQLVTFGGISVLAVAGLIAWLLE